MKIKLLQRLRNDILQNFEYHDGGWSGYYRVKQIIHERKGKKIGNKQK